MSCPRSAFIGRIHVMNPKSNRLLKMSSLRLRRKSVTPNEEGVDQTIIEHLTELRTRLILAVYGLVVGFGLCWWKSELLFDFMRKPIVPFLTSGGLVFTGILDKFMAHLQIAMLGAVMLTAPWWLYQVWAFVAPGLYRKEKKF